MPSLFEQPQEPVELSTGAGRGTADRIGRNRKRASLRRPTTSQAARRLVARRARGIHARFADNPNKRRLGRLLEKPRPNRRPRSKPEQPPKLTKSRRLIAPLWFAPGGQGDLLDSASRKLRFPVGPD